MECFSTKKRASGEGGAEGQERRVTTNGAGVQGD